MKFREEEVRFEMVQNQLDVINRLEKIAGDPAEMVYHRVDVAENQVKMVVSQVEMVQVSVDMAVCQVDMAG